MAEDLPSLFNFESLDGLAHFTFLEGQGPWQRPHSTVASPPTASNPSPDLSEHSWSQSSEAVFSDLSAMAADLLGPEDDDAEGRTRTVRRCKASTMAAFRQSLTAREIKMLEAEHAATLPTHDFALTREEQRQLRVALRKVRNKISAQDSRVRKREYVGDLEERVKTCTIINIGLQERVQQLETENRSLLQQIQVLQQQLAAKMGGHTGTCLMILGLCFAICFAPGSLGLVAAPGGSGGGGSSSSALHSQGFQSRTLKGAELAVAPAWWQRLQNLFFAADDDAQALEQPLLAASNVVGGEERNQTDEQRFVGLRPRHGTSDL